MAEPLSRHHLVWLQSFWSDHLKGLDGEALAIAADWFGRDLPAVARRRTEADPGDAVPLGIPLSPQKGRRRLALSVPAWQVREVLPPLALARVIPSALPAWQAPLAELNSRLAAAGLSARVYGSLAWQHITGEGYLTDRSDVDLLLWPQNRFQLERALSLLQDWERQTSLRADGELQLPNGAVAWRELLSAPDRVLVKTAQTVMLYPMAELFAAIETGYASATS